MRYIEKIVLEGKIFLLQNALEDQEDIRNNTSYKLHENGGPEDVISNHDNGIAGVILEFEKISALYLHHPSFTFQYFCSQKIMIVILCLQQFQRKGLTYLLPLLNSKHCSLNNKVCSVNA